MVGNGIIFPNNICVTSNKGLMNYLKLEQFFQIFCFQLALADNQVIIVPNEVVLQLSTTKDNYYITKIYTL